MPAAWQGRPAASRPAGRPAGGAKTSHSACRQGQDTCAAVGEGVCAGHSGVRACRLEQVHLLRGRLRQVPGVPLVVNSCTPACPCVLTAPTLAPRMAPTAPCVSTGRVQAPPERDVLPCQRRHLLHHAWPHRWWRGAAGGNACHPTSCASLAWRGCSAAAAAPKAAHPREHAAPPLRLVSHDPLRQRCGGGAKRRRGVFLRRGRQLDGRRCGARAPDALWPAHGRHWRGGCLLRLACFPPRLPS